MIPERVRRWALGQPDQPAVVGASGQLTYGQLWRLALDWSAALGGHLTGPEPLVGVLCPRGVVLPAMQLAAWLAGAAYLLLDPLLPAGRIATILDDAGCRLVLAAESLRGALPPSVTAITAPGDGRGRVPRGCRPEALAYVVYTSGSTGRPKGVEIEHRNLANIVDWNAERFHLGPGVRSAMLAGLGFDVSALDVFGALAVGATLVVPEESVVRDPAAIAELLDHERVHHCFVPTPLAAPLWSAETPPRALRSVAVGGGRMGAWPPADFPAAIYNVYGPAEATVYSTASDDLRGDPRRYAEPSSPPPIGRAVRGAVLGVVDEDGSAVHGPGITGELLVGGAGLTRGYRNRPDLTADAYVDLDLGDGLRRWYRTGDYVRWTPASELEFVGRRDGQVKVRGNRVELGEIEHAIASCPEVEQVVVLAPERAEGERVPLAWVTAAPGASTREADLVARLRAELPGYMLPARVRFLASMPLTVNGKIDHDALLADAARDRDQPGGDRLTMTEEVVAGVWEEVLRVPAGRTDDFFAIGGDSLAAGRVTARLRRVLGVQLPVALLARNPTLRRFSAAVDLVVRSARSLPVEPVVAISRREALPLSHLQENRLLREARARSASGRASPMRVPVAIAIEAAVSDGAIADALDRVVAAYEPFRTGFRADVEPDRLEVFVRGAAAVSLVVRSARPSGPADRQRLLEEAQAELMSALMPLDQPPLLRALLYRFGAADAVLLVAVDHLVMDGWSVPLLVRGLARAVDAPGERLPQPALQHLDWAAWQRRQLAGPAWEPLIGYWRDRLRGTSLFPPLPLPAPPSPEPAGRAEACAALGQADVARLRRVVRAHGASLFTAALASVARAWTLRTGASGVVIHSPTANRALPETEDMIGWFAHSVVFRLDADPGGSAAGDLERARDTVREALVHQDVPLPLLVRKLEPQSHGRASRPARLFLGFSTRREVVEPVAGGTLRLLELPEQDAAAEPGLSFYVMEDGGRVEVRCVYDRAAVCAEFVEQLVDDVVASLRDMEGRAPSDGEWA